jgi:hypothetical protein
MDDEGLGLNCGYLTRAQRLLTRIVSLWQRHSLSRGLSGSALQCPLPCVGGSPTDAARPTHFVGHRARARLPQGNYILYNCDL